MALKDDIALLSRVPLFSDLNDEQLRLIAFGDLIQYWRDGKKVFEYRDPEPYTEGWFGIRTTRNHMRVRNLRIYRLTTG